MGDSAQRIGILGGTGPLGRGLGLRLAMAGRPVVLGSRDAHRAAEAVGRARARAPDACREGLDLRGATNADAAACDVVIVALPRDGQVRTLPALAESLRGKVVLSCANHLGFDGTGPRPLPVEAGSSAQEVALLLPGARVVGAFQNVSATALLRAGSPVDADVLLTGDDAGAKEVAARLVAAVDGMRPVDAGSLRLSRVVEDLTAVLIGINRRYGVHAGIRIAGLSDDAAEQWPA